MINNKTILQKFNKVLHRTSLSTLYKHNNLVLKKTKNINGISNKEINILNFLDPSYLGINYTGIIPYLVGAIKEINTNHVNETTQLKTEINSLKTTISTLESQFNILQAQMNTLLNQ